MLAALFSVHADWEGRLTHYNEDPEGVVEEDY